MINAAEAFDWTIPEPGSGRVVKLWTGIEGAKNHERTLREYVHTLAGGVLTEEVKEEIRLKVEAIDWQPGMYKLSESGCEYVGLHDDSITDGVKLVQRNTDHFLEEWKGGWRTNYEKITAEEFEKLRISHFPDNVK